MLLLQHVQHDLSSTTLYIVSSNDCFCTERQGVWGSFVIILNSGSRGLLGGAVKLGCCGSTSASCIPTTSWTVLLL